MTSGNTPEWNANATVLVESRLAGLHRSLMLKLTGFPRLAADRNVRLLDVGCGSGPWLARFARDGYKDLHGAEPDAELRAAVPEGLRASVKGCPAERLDYPDASFDVVWVYCVLHHLKGADAYRAACAEIHRVLKPGGLVFIVEPGRYRLFVFLEYVVKVLGIFSRTFRAFAYTMDAERPEQHFFLKNHPIVRDSLLAKGFTPLVDTYFFYSWIFTGARA